VSTLRLSPGSFPFSGKLATRTDLADPPFIDMDQPENNQSNQQGNNQQGNNQQGNDQFIYQNADMDMGEGSNAGEDGLEPWDVFLRQPLVDDQQRYNNIMYGTPDGLSNPNEYFQTDQYDQSRQYVPQGQYPPLGQFQSNQFQGNEFQDNKSQFPSLGVPQYSAPSPVPRPATPLPPAEPLPPIMGLVKDGTKYPKSESGPLPNDVPIEFARPAQHVLLEENPLLRQQRLLYYVDASKQREKESFRDYTLRMTRANENMGLEVRQRPALPPRTVDYITKKKEYNSQSHQRRRQQEKDEKDHQGRLASDQLYRQKWQVDKVNRQARNAQRRRRGTERLRNEYDNIGILGFPSPLSVDDSGDELYTFDEGGPLFGINGPRRGPPPTGNLNSLYQRSAAPSTSPSNSIQEETPVVEDEKEARPPRCKRCVRLRRTCPLKWDPTLPCATCANDKENGRLDVEECVLWEPQKRGPKLGSRCAKNQQGGKREPARERSRSASPSRGSCKFCQLYSLTCDGKRPCDQCINYKEDCDGDIQGQNYEPTPQGSMTDPFAGFHSSFNTPLQGYSNTRGFMAQPPQRDPNLQPFGGVRTSFQGSDMRYPAAAATLQETASLTGLGGSQPFAPGSNQQNDWNPFGEPVPNAFDPFAIQNSGNDLASINTQVRDLVPTLFSSNPQLPPAIGLEGMSASALPPAPTGSPVLPKIKIIRLAQTGYDKSGMNAEEACNETIDTFDEIGFEMCNGIPTMSCEHLEHGDYNVCGDCHFAADFEYHPTMVQIAHFTKTPTCQICADAKRVALVNGDVNVRQRCCLCVGQMQQAWLCKAHTEEAFAEVRRKACLNLEWAQRTLWANNKPRCYVCSIRDIEPRSRGWVCIACGEEVVEL
jgi:hypothetical protein